MMHKAPKIRWQTGLPLTFGEQEGRKEAAIVRASVRIAVFRQLDSITECLFISHPVKGFEVPGGAVDPDEEPLGAALRELSEEAGLELDVANGSVRLAGFVPITDQQNGRWLDIVYIATIEAVDDFDGKSEAEFAVTWLNVEDVEQHLTTNARRVIDCALKYNGFGD